MKGLWLRPPEADERKAILYLHGGAYIAGIPIPMPGWSAPWLRLPLSMFLCPTTGWLRNTPFRQGWKTHWRAMKG